MSATNEYIGHIYIYWELKKEEEEINHNLIFLFFHDNDNFYDYLAINESEKYITYTIGEPRQFPHNHSCLLLISK